MDNVIAFPTTVNKTTDIGYINNIPVQNPRTARDYLILLKEFLEVEDYEEVLLCIMDIDYYNDAESQIQKIVNCYHSY